MTKYQKDLRRYYFRTFIARKDAAVCQRGAGPFVLSWPMARHFWHAAGSKARWHAFVD